MRYETTVGTLTTWGSTFFTSLMKHAECADGDSDMGEIFIDRDGAPFGALLSYMRTGILSLPPGVSMRQIRVEADYYCVSIERMPSPRLTNGAVRCDGLYLSFGTPRVPDLAGCEAGGPSGAAEGEVRAYLHFKGDGFAVLGRREADGQWSALRCKYSTLAGALLMVSRAEAPATSSPDEGSGGGGGGGGNGGGNGGAEGEGGGWGAGGGAALVAALNAEAGAAEGPRSVAPAARREAMGERHLELSAVVLDSGAFIEVLTCRRVGRLENPFHFFPSSAPTPGSTFISHAAPPAPGRTAAGRVVLAFESANTVGVMVTASMPGWSSAAASVYCAQLGRARAPRAGRGSPRADGRHADGSPDPARSRSPRGEGSELIGAHVDDALWHVGIDNGNFDRTLDFVSLGERGLVEFVQLHSQHEPQAIWYRPLLRRANPWGADGPS